MQAAIVRRILEEYADGLSPRQIAARLNREGVPGPRGGEWNASTINGSRQRRNGILNIELYTGHITYNRQRFVKDPETGRRIARLNPEHEWVVKEVPELRIVDDDLWQRVQAIKGTHASRWGGKKRLLTGLVKCGCCGGSMTIVNRDRYYCSAKRERGTCSNATGISATELESRVLEGLKDILVGNEEEIERFATEFKAELVRLRKQRGTVERQTLKELNRVNAAIKRCLRYVTDGDGPPGLGRDELTALEIRKRDLERTLALIREEPAVDLHPNLAELYRKKVLKAQSLLLDEKTQPPAMEEIRSLIKRIEVHTGKECDKPQIIVVGELARILDYTQKSTTAASGNEDGGRFSMVAGAGFEPTTFRL